jgi:uncharacterized membrane protein
MERFENTCDILAPVETCYTHWIQFEQFPQFMGQVKSVTRLEGNQWRWIVHEPFGPDIACDTEVRTDDTTYAISWQTLPNAPLAMKGSVRFDVISAERTRLHCSIDYQVPDAALQDALVEMNNLTRQMVDRDLKSFKYWVENNPSPPQNANTLSAKLADPILATSVAEPLRAELTMVGLEDDILSNENDAIALNDDDESADDPTLRQLRREESPYLGLATSTTTDLETERILGSSRFKDEEKSDLFAESMDAEKDDLANFTEDLSDDIDGALPSGSRYEELSFNAIAAMEAAEESSLESARAANRPKTSRLAE